MGNGGPDVPARPALELWVLGWHMATEVALGSPRLVPTIVFTGLEPGEAVPSWDLEGRSSMPPAGGGMSLPSCWTHLEHTNTQGWQDTKHRACQAEPCVHGQS